MLKSNLMKKPCLVSGCNKKLRGGCGYCKNHYYYYKRYGSPLAPKVYDCIRRDHPIEYRAWKEMMQRCYNKNNNRYNDYGKRGIKVCNRWMGRHRAKNFYNDMGDKPSKTHSLDRINVNGDYCPENCRWANRWTQARNKRNNTEHPCITPIETDAGVAYHVKVVVNGKRFTKTATTLFEAIIVRDSYTPK